MDFFMDKLVERINAQNSIRSQSVRTNVEATPQSVAQPAPASAPAPQPVAEAVVQAQPVVAPAQPVAQAPAVDPQMAEMIVKTILEAIDKTNADCVELVSEYGQANQASRLSATEEMMAAQASAREAIIEAINAAITDLKNTPAPSANVDTYDLENLVASSAADIKGVVVTKSSDVKSVLEASMLDVKNDFDNRVYEIIEAIRTLTAQLASEDNANEDEDTLGAIKDALTANQTEMTEHVHKEVVKCYKNTQAAMEESFTNQAESLGGLLKKANPALKKLAIAAVVLSGLNFAGIVAILLWIFRII